MFRRRFFLLALVAGLFVAALPAAAEAPHGSVVAWGCGRGDDWGQCTVPAAAASGVMAIAAGTYHSLALKRDGSVIAWGCRVGDYGQCTVPAAAASGVTAIAAGTYHSLALKRDGSVIAWGCGGGFTYGQCAVPAVVTSGVTAIAAGSEHNLALKDRSVIAWGCGGGADFGQCAVPAAAGSGVTAIAAGSSHSLALKQDGSVIAWGCGGIADFGQCAVPAAAASGVTAIAAGSEFSLVLKQDGSVIAWGCGSNAGISRDFGQCVVPAAAASGVTAIAAGVFHSLALKQDGSVIAWGCRYSDDGQCTVPAAATRWVTAIAAGAVQSLALSDPLEQTITVTMHAPAVATYNVSFSVAGSSSSGLPVVFSSSGVCSNAGATFTMTGGTGTCLVKYDQPGDGAYEAAPQLVESVAAQKAEQTITFGALAAKTYGDPDFPVNASASSGLAVSFSASGNCTLSGPLVHITGAGTCAVTASQPGDANYNAAPNASQSFSVAKANQTITFGALANKANGAANFTVSASASSGLAVSFAARGKCSVSAATVHLTGAGSCTVTASQPGDANYNPAPDVSRTFSIARVPCTVPRVVGKQLAVAKQTIKRRHCRTGKVGYSYSGTSKNGIVIRQSRRPGRVAPADSKIDLVVSRGRR